MHGTGVKIIEFSVL